LLRISGKAGSNAAERTYASGFSYTPDGRIQRLKLGNNRWESANFNERLQVMQLALGSSDGDGSLWKLNYEYGELESNGTVNTTKNTGNIARQTVSFAGLQNPFVQTFKYDSLERLTEAKETVNSNQTWKQQFGYDRFGNRTGFEQIIGQTQLQISNLTHPTINPTTNRFDLNQGYIYDRNGNLTIDAQNRQFVFNGDNKQREVRDQNGNKVGEYFYDGEGKRVKKKVYDPTSGQVTEETVFVYSAGRLVAEYSSASLPEIKTTSYTATDMLGSPRVITDASGQVTSRRDFMPFGEELNADGTYRKSSSPDKYGQADSVRQRFTGYQKDAETNLDFAEARYYHNQHARFTAVDPLLASGKSANPQTFNRYVYCLNNPLIFTDPNGLQAGSWYYPVTKSGEIDPTRSYSYINKGDSTEGYKEVTEKNKWGELIGSWSGSPRTGIRFPELPDYVIRFNPMGPREPQPMVNFNGVKSMEKLSDYERYGWETIKSDDYYINHPVPGTVVNAIEPYEVALFLTPMKFSVIGNGARIEATTSKALVPALDETFNQSLANEAIGKTENILGYRIDGTKGLAGNTFNRNILSISREQSGRSIQGFRQLISTMEAEASQSGANQFSIIGHATHNSGFFNASTASRFGYTFRQVNNETVHFFRNLKP
jgi:RHS repeat-associated protein